MAKSEQFNASVNFGGSIDSSLGRSLKWLTSNIQDTEKVTLKAMGVQTKWMKDLQEGSSSTTSKLKLMGQSMGALVAKQTALENKIRAGVRAGEDVSKLAAEYKTVAVGISRAEKELEKLNTERKKEQDLEEGAQRKAAKQQRRHDRWQSFSSAVGRGGLSVAHGIGQGLKWGAVGATGLAIGLPGMVIAANKKLAEEASIAKSYGLSYEKYKAGSILAEQAGLNGENFGDLAEELSNKVGEQGNEKTVNPMLGQIGLLKSRMLKMSKSEQFDTVMQAITSRVKSGGMTATQGESLADQLMGGEANKLATYIIGLNQTYDEVMKSSSRLNNTTNAEAEGAIEASRTLSNIWTSGETALMGMAGEVGNALQPQLKSMEDSALTWIKENKDAIAKSIGDWATGGGPQRLVNGLKLFGEEVEAVGVRLKWIIPETRSPEDMDTAEEARRRARELAVDSPDYPSFWSSLQDKSRFVDKKGDEGEAKWRLSHGVTNDDAYNHYGDGALGGIIPPVNSAASITHAPTFNFEVHLAPGSPVDMAQDLYEQTQKLLGGVGFSPTVDLPN